MARTALAAALPLLALLAGATVALGGPPRGGPPRDGLEAEYAVAAALRAFDNRIASPDPGARTAAIRALGEHDHPVVARRLLRVATAGKLPHSTRGEAVNALSKQRTSASTLAAAVGKLLTIEAKRKRKGILDVELDENNEVVTTTPAGKHALRLVRERGAFSEACVRCLLTLEDWRFVEDGRLYGLLENGHDGLTTALLETFAHREDWRALEAIHELFRIYPYERKWSVSHILVHSRINDAHAKLNYMRRFGDPGITRVRPRVVAAIRKTLTAITGETFEEPTDLERFLKRRDVKQKMKHPPRARMHVAAKGR